MEAVKGRATVSSKVGLNDLFYVKTDDQSRFRVYTNKIDRKHVDFLLCELSTMRPLIGIELDDKSHQRADRQARDEFVDQVFKASGLPILHIPAKRSYAVAEIAAQLSPVLGVTSTPVSAPTSERAEQPFKTQPNVPPGQATACPKCGNPCSCGQPGLGPIRAVNSGDAQTIQHAGPCCRVWLNNDVNSKLGEIFNETC